MFRTISLALALAVGCATTSEIDPRVKTENQQRQEQLKPTLEDHVGQLGLFPRATDAEAFIRGYDSRQNYQNQFTGLGERLQLLEMVSYAIIHGEEFRYDLDVVVELNRQGSISAGYANDRNDAWLTLRRVRYTFRSGHTSEDYIAAYFPARPGSIDVEQERVNQRFYIGVFFLQQAAEELTTENQRWLARPWRPLASKKYQERFTFDPALLPYEEHSGEFVFFGQEACPPCSEVVDFLLEQKIRFREQLWEGPAPTIFYQDQTISGADEVITRIREMYGIAKDSYSPPKLPPGELTEEQQRGS